jgi:hypothetical protein
VAQTSSFDVCERWSFQAPQGWRFAETMRSVERGQGKQRHLGSTRD